jgi:hypothetical protein
MRTTLSETMKISRREFAKDSVLIAIGGGTLALAGCPTVAQWEAIVINDLPGILQVVAEILSIAGDPSVGAILEAKVQQVTAQVSADLNLISTLTLNYQAKASTTILADIDAALTDAQTNLSALLAAFHVENPQLMVTIAGILGVAISAVTGLMILIPPPPQPSATRVYLVYGGTGQNAIKLAYNQIVQIYYPKYLLR